MMSPYGGPYAAVYPHGGGVYAHPHPGIPMGSSQPVPPLAATVSGIGIGIGIASLIASWIYLLMGSFVNGSSRGRL